MNRTLDPFLNFYLVLSSQRRGHANANLHCITPILSDLLEGILCSNITKDEFTLALLNDYDCSNFRDQEVDLSSLTYNLYHILNNLKMQLNVCKQQIG